MTTRILVVDNEGQFRQELVSFLASKGYEVSEASSAEEALGCMGDCYFDLVLLDLGMPEMLGLDVMRHVMNCTPETAVIVITACASLDSAIEALRYGALDYLTKPLDLPNLALKLERVNHMKTLFLDNQLLRRIASETPGFGEIVGESAAIKQVFHSIQQLSESNVNVLITGDSGVGKELIARAVHDNSPGRERLFIPVNISAIPSNLMESRLFGHVRGAFTGATKTHRGLFQTVRGGTIFLDEIGELPIEIQPKLLRAIEEHEIFPLGAETPAHVDFRLIAATNRNLLQMVEAREFREDLYYRLNVFQIPVPSLRERREDIPLLVNYFIADISQALNKPIRGVDRQAMERLITSEWKGNIRELRNVIERAIILADTAWITIEQLPDMSDVERPASLRLSDVVDQTERRHIQMVLKLSGNNRKLAAKTLGVSLATFYRRLEKHGILEHGVGNTSVL